MLENNLGFKQIKNLKKTDKFKGRNVLILGGLGFIGSNLAHRLVELGATVVLVDSMLEQYGGNMSNIEGIEDKVKINFSDIRDDHSLRYIVRNVDVNGINKLAAENYYRLYSKVHGLKCISLRLTNTYGPRQQLHGNTQGFAGIFIRKAIDGEKIKIFGTGEQLRDFNYIDDVVDACLLSVDYKELFG